MPNEREEAIKRAIRKLKELEISNEEILANLIDSGVEQETAEKLLNDVEGEAAPAPEAEKPIVPKAPLKPKPIIRREYEGLPLEESEIEGLSITEPAPPKKSAVKAPKPAMSVVEGEDLGVWSTGIIEVVEEKLEEIEEKKEEISNLIRQQVSGEMQRIKVALDKDKQDLLAKIEAEVGKKLSDAAVKIEQGLTKIDIKKELITGTVADATRTLEELKSLKAEITARISEMQQISSNADAKSKQLTQTLESEQKKIDSALKLQSKILSALQTKVDKKYSELEKKELDLEKLVREGLPTLRELAPKLKKVEDLLAQLSTRSAELEAIKNVSEQSVTEVKTLKSRIAQLLTRQATKKEPASEEELKRIKELSEKSALELEQLKAKIADLAKKDLGQIVKAKEGVSLDLEKKLAEMDSFLKNVQQKLDNFEKARASLVALMDEKFTALEEIRESLARKSII